MNTLLITKEQLGMIDEAWRVASRQDGCSKRAALGWLEVAMRNLYNDIIEQTPEQTPLGTPMPSGEPVSFSGQLHTTPCPGESCASYGTSHLHAELRDSLYYRNRDDAMAELALAVEAAFEGGLPQHAINRLVKAAKATAKYDEVQP